MTSFSFFVSRSLCNRCCFQEGTTTSNAEFVGLVQVLVQIPPRCAIPQKNVASFAHQVDAFASAGRTNMELCNNQYRAIVGCGQSA